MCIERQQYINLNTISILPSANVCADKYWRCSCVLVLLRPSVTAENFSQLFLKSKFVLNSFVNCPDL